MELRREIARRPGKWNTEKRITELFRHFQNYAVNLGP